MNRVLLYGLGVWAAGTLLFRLQGHRLLHPQQPLRTALLYLISFVLMALLVPRIFRRLQLPRESWHQAATLLMLPTLMLDPFSCAFFPSVFPNMDPAAAGIFGGDRKSTRLNSSHIQKSRMPSSA